MNSDHTAHTDGLLMHELTVVNTQLARYVLRYLDADAGRTEPVTVADELALADSVATAAEAIRARAERRQRDVDTPADAQTPGDTATATEDE